jgi:PQQ-like domain
VPATTLGPIGSNVSNDLAPRGRAVHTTMRATEGNVMPRWVSRLVHGGVALSVVAAAAGCWPSSGGGPNRAAYNSLETVVTTASIGTMAESWTVQFGPGAVSDPVRLAGAVQVIATDPEHGSHSVYAVTQSGTTSWELDGRAGGPEHHYDGELVLAGNQIGVSSYDSTLAAEQQWTHQWVDVDTHAPVGPSWSGELVARRGDVAMALNTNDATRPQPFTLWMHQLDSLASWGGYVGSEILATFGDRLYQSGFGMTNVSFPPTFGNGVRAYPTFDQGTNCVLEFMCPTWAVPVDGTSATPVVVGPGETTYTVTDVGTVYALGAEGETRWTGTVAAPVSHPPALARGLVYVPTDDGRIVVFAADGCGAPTCAPLWTSDVGSTVSNQPAVAADVVFVATQGGGLYAFAADGCGASNCTDLWSAQLGSEITGAPAVSGGQLYVGTADGRLVAFAPEP